MSLSRIGLLLIFVVIIAASILADHTTAQPTLPGQRCRIKPLDNWSEPEKWAWQEICERRLANFNKRLGKEFDPRAWTGGTNDRKLSSAFLETVLLHEPFRGAQSRWGVRIIGAWLSGPIDLQGATLDHDLWLDGCRFEADVKLLDLEAKKNLSLENSHFNGKLIMDRVQVGANFSISGSTAVDMVILSGSRVVGVLSMIGSTIHAPLVMDGLQVGGSLHMDSRSGHAANFTYVRLVNAEIDGLLTMWGSKFSEELDMSGLAVRGSLSMGDKGEFTKVILDRARIDGDLSIEGSTFGRDVNVTSAEIGKNFKLSGAKVTSVDLTGTRIAGELFLGSETSAAPTWEGESKLILQNAEIGAIQDRQDAWPNRLQVDGLTYRRLGGFAAHEGSSLLNRDVEWFENWLAKQETYSPQPYTQLASILKAAGREEAATTLLYASRKRGLKELTGWAKVAGVLQLVFIGFGYRMWYSIFWILGLVGLGAVVFRSTQEAKAYGMNWCIAYSLDMLLPIVRLREFHYQIDLKGGFRPARYYFYFHQIMGYVLASFLIAGLSGLTR